MCSGWHFGGMQHICLSEYDFSNPPVRLLIQSGDRQVDFVSPTPYLFNDKDSGLLGKQQVTGVEAAPGWTQGPAFTAVSFLIVPRASFMSWFT